MTGKIIIRSAELGDLEKITELERQCFPAAEAASAVDLHKRLKVYADHFWLLEIDGKIVSMINGMVTNEPDFRDEMYHNAELHDEKGKWQMIFGVETHPDFRGRGYASTLLERVIADAKADGREGIVLTCKEELVPYYERFGFVNEGVSASEHGNVVWYQMRKILKGRG